MSTKRTSKLTIVNDTHDAPPPPRSTNTLRLKLDSLKAFTPLTENQKIFFDAYKRGDYFVALHGVAGTGKTFIAC